MIYAIGDIHGRADLLRQAMSDIKLRSKRLDDKIVFLGDYVDRGPDSKGVIDLVREEVRHGRAVALMGNHEDYFLQYLNREAIGYIWFDHYAWATIPSYIPGWERNISPQTHEEIRARVGDHKEFLESLPFMHVTEHHVFVHGGLMPGVELKDQTSQECMWIRDRFLKAHPDYRKDWGDKHVVHGHTPVPHDPAYVGATMKPAKAKEPLSAVCLDWRTNLDTGACFEGGRLAVGVFDQTQPGGPSEVLYFEE